MTDEHILFQQVSKLFLVESLFLHDIKYVAEKFEKLQNGVSNYTNNRHKYINSYLLYHRDKGIKKEGVSQGHPLLYYSPSFLSWSENLIQIDN